MISTILQAMLSSILATSAMVLIRLGIAVNVLPRLPSGSSPLSFLCAAFTTPLVCAGLAAGFASTVNVILMFRRTEFIVAIPLMAAAGWIVGVGASLFVLHEPLPATRIVGLVLSMAGAALMLLSR